MPLVLPARASHPLAVLASPVVLWLRVAYPLAGGIPIPRGVVPESAGSAGGVVVTRDVAEQRAESKRTVVYDDSKTPRLDGWERAREWIASLRQHLADRTAWAS